MNTRRFATLAATASVAALALTGCVQSSSGPGGAGGESDSKDLTVFVATDTNIQELWEETLIPAFEEAHEGYTVKLEFDLHGQHDQQTVAKLTAATVQEKDPGFDLMDGGFVRQIAASGLLTVPTDSDIPELKDIPTDTLTAGGEGGIPYRASSVLLAYDTAAIQTPPQTLADLLAWIKDNPGKFTYNSPDTGGSGQSFVTTVLDQYVPDADRTQMEADYVPDLESLWDQGFKDLRALNPYVFQEGVYPNGNNQVLELLSSGQISMAPVWSDQFITGQKNGQIPEQISYTQITDPSLTGGASYLGIPKASPRQEAAFTLMSWLLSPPAQELISDDIAGYPVVKLDKLSPEVQAKFADAGIDLLRPQYFASMLADMNKLWSEKVPGK